MQPNTTDMLEDEACHLRPSTSSQRATVSLKELMESDSGCNVTLHNTMRFDVHLAHIQPMLDEGLVDKQELAEAIIKAIVGAVEDVIGKGLDGVPIPGGPMFIPVSKSKMLHRETISFDLS